MIRVARVYDATLPDGARFLVDRVWPRGVRRDQLAATWLRDVAPSAALRRAFGHDPARWEEFRVRYAAELDARRDAWAPIATAARDGDVVLLYAARDTEHNNAVALAAYVADRLAAAPAICRGCGVVPASGAAEAPATWTSTRVGSGVSWLCESCTRANVRALEARLDPAWW